MIAKTISAPSTSLQRSKQTFSKKPFSLSLSYSQSKNGHTILIAPEKKFSPKKQTNKQTKKTDMEILLKTHTKSQFETTTRQRPHKYNFIFILYAISIPGDYATTKTEKPGHLDLPHNSLQN
jgi:hypothetical protein